MDNPKNLENIVIYSFVGIEILGFAMYSRVIAIGLGLDNFTSTFVFIGVLILGIGFFSMIKLFFHEIVTIIFRNKKKKEKLLDENSSNDSLQNSDIQNTLIETEELPIIVNQKIEKKQAEEKLNIAIKYTLYQFASYASKKDIEILCENIKIYAEKGNFENIKPISINESLTVKDLKHFGWNIWNHFGKKTNQEKIVIFLKKTFPNSLGNIKDTSLKSNLTVDGNDGKIMIEKSLS